MRVLEVRLGDHHLADVGISLVRGRARSAMAPHPATQPGVAPTSASLRCGPPATPTTSVATTSPRATASTRPPPRRPRVAVADPGSAASPDGTHRPPGSGGAASAGRRWGRPAAAWSARLVGSPRTGRPGAPAPGPGRGRRGRRAGAAPRGGPGCGGAGDRRSTGRPPARGRAWRHSATVSARRRSSSGRRGCGAMPARPVGPAPRRRWSSTVSARSSAVWPVSDVGGQHPVAGGAGPGLQVGPGVTSTRSARNPAPNRRAASATTSASAAEPGRRPWSTCTAVASHPAATASTSSASESAPPDTAHVTGVPAGGRSSGPSRSHDRRGRGRGAAG
jgi:hypothetical protein